MKLALLPVLLLGISFQAQAMEDSLEMANPGLVSSSSPTMVVQPDLTNNEPQPIAQSAQLETLSDYSENKEDKDKIHSSDILNALEIKAGREINHAAKDIEKAGKKASKDVEKAGKKASRKLRKAFK